MENTVFSNGVGIEVGNGSAITGFRRGNNSTTAQTAKGVGLLADFNVASETGFVAEEIVRLGADVAISSITETAAGAKAQIVTAAVHNLSLGDIAMISAGDHRYTESWRVFQVIDPTTFDIQVPEAGIGNLGAGVATLKAPTATVKQITAGKLRVKLTPRTTSFWAGGTLTGLTSGETEALVSITTSFQIDYDNMTQLSVTRGTIDGTVRLQAEGRGDRHCDRAFGEGLGHGANPGRWHGVHRR